VSHRPLLFFVGGFGLFHFTHPCVLVVWHAPPKESVRPVVWRSVCIPKAERKDEGGASEHRLKTD